MKKSFATKLAAKSTIDHKINLGTNIKSIHASLSEEIEYASFLLYKENILKILAQLSLNDTLSLNVANISESNAQDAPAFDSDGLIDMIAVNNNLSNKYLNDLEIYPYLIDLDVSLYDDSQYDTVLNEYNSRLSRLDLVRRSHSYTLDQSEAWVINNELMTAYITHDLIVVKYLSTGNIHSLGVNSYVILKSDCRINFITSSERLDGNEHICMFVSYHDETNAIELASDYAAVTFAANNPYVGLIPFSIGVIDNKQISMIYMEKSIITSIKYTQGQGIKDNRIKLERLVGDCGNASFMFYSYMDINSHNAKQLHDAAPGSEVFDLLASKL
ncbi:hypothetical protein LMH73_010635 [Vibrio splendidus]|nr:hypothetical protein [Vibrio splendidus]MCC4880403.1 hypothetical protein [Vibrio splendidus]